jgi:hypothetical protein
MKIIEVFTTSILLLLPGAILPAYGQGQHEQEKQPEQKQAKPAAQPQHAAQQAKPARQSQPAAQHAAQPREAKPAQQQPQHAAQQREAKPTQQPQHAAQQREAKPARQSQPAAQHAAQQREAKPAQQRQGAQQANRGQSGGGRGSIPEARFRSNFGRSHTFHVNRNQFANGSGRFQYGGYWFNVIDPWPVGWLYTDDVYVDYINGGYFLCDPFHPGVYISINIG